MFSLFKVLLLLSAFMVLLVKNPIHSVLFLILAFCNGAGLLLLFGMEFLAITFLVVYAGAVAVLFLFIVMMLNLKVVEFRQTLLNHYPVSLLLLLSLFLESFLSISGLALPSSAPYPEWSGLLLGQSNVQVLGGLLYTYYYLPFLVAGLILLLAMLGSIVLTFSRKEGDKRQQIYDQVVRETTL